METKVSRGWLAPAKVNLFLHITGRREDGYHTLQTAFQFVGVADSLDFKIRKDGRVRRINTPDEMLDVSGERDLSVQAARTLQTYSVTSLGVDIVLNKTIPIGGGLGGGSSDAATTLVALNHLWELGLEVDVLAELGLQLGADVPVFVRGHAAWAEGVGERLVAIDPPKLWYLIVTPDCHVATSEVFSAPELTRNTPPITMHDFLRQGGCNDCEAVVRRRYPAVGKALDWLAGYADARLTGTGASVFATFQTRDGALRVLADVPEGWRGFVGRGLNRSPLLDRLVAGD